MPNPKEGTPDNVQPGGFVSLGPLFVPEDYVFLRDRNMDMERASTPAELARARIIRRELFSDLRREKETMLESVVEDASSESVSVEKLPPGRSIENRFRLTMNPVDINVDQEEKRTHLYFLPDKDIAFGARDFYALFFDKLPKSIYGKDSKAANPRRIKNLTRTIVTPTTGIKKILDFKKLEDKREFEEMMDIPEDIMWVTMNVATDLRVLYSLTIPNPNSKKERFVRFTIFSHGILPSNAIKVLLDLHQYRKKIKGEEDNYSVCLAESINVIRERLRVA